MRIFGKVVLSAAALALAGGLSVGSVQAAPAIGKVAASSQLELVAGKKKTAAKKRTGKKVASKKARPGGCGVMNYYDRKTGKCASAMSKKS